MHPRQRLILAIPVVIALAAGVGLWVSNVAGEDKASDGIVEAFIPSPNEKVFQQAEVGIDLISGWDAELTVNGKPIPPDQLRKIVAQSKFTFVPGSGMEVAAYNPGQNCALVKYWPLSSPNQTFTKSWCFTVF